MAIVYLSIGSNIDRENNIRSCMARLTYDYPDIVFSTIYETEAVGFKGDPFLNLTAELETDLNPQQIESYLKSIEDEHQRSREGEKYSSRTLDIDLLLYDQLILHPEMDVPRNEITRYGFVLFPLAEIAPDLIHPVLKKSMNQLVAETKLSAESHIAIDLNHKNIRNFEGSAPKFHPSVYIDDSSIVIGNVIIGENSSVWPLTVIRGDIQSITIGERTNIQDGSTLHVTHGSDFSKAEGYPLSIGDDVTVGHSAVLHGCTIKNRCLIGMGAIVLDGAIVEDEVMIGAGSLVPPGKTLESGYMWLGSPVKKVRELTEKEKSFFCYSAQNYSNLSRRTKT